MNGTGSSCLHRTGILGAPLTYFNDGGGGGSE